MILNLDGLKKVFEGVKLDSNWRWVAQQTIHLIVEPVKLESFNLRNLHTCA
jgi:hypothetical protein